MSYRDTITSCYQAYCFWGSETVNAPYYGAYFVSLFLGSENNSRLIMLDPGNTSLAAYLIFNANGAPLRALLYNSDYFTSGIRSNSTFTLNLSGNLASVRIKRISAPSATSLGTDGELAIGGGLRFDNSCVRTGNDGSESLRTNGRSVVVAVQGTEAAIVYLS